MPIATMTIGWSISEDRTIWQEPSVGAYNAPSAMALAMVGNNGNLGSSVA